MSTQPGVTYLQGLYPSFSLDALSAAEVSEGEATTLALLVLKEISFSASLFGEMTDES